MTSRLEWLLSVISLGSTCRAPVESPSTAPSKMSRAQALGEISYATQGELRLEVFAALLRMDPSKVSSEEESEVRMWLADNVVVYALALRRPFPQERLPDVAYGVASAALTEHIEWEPCRVCNGKGRVAQLKDDGTGVHEVRCPKCEGAKTLPWSDRRRARGLGLSLSTAQNRWLELYDFAIAKLQQWAAEGEQEFSWRRE